MRFCCVEYTTKSGKVWTPLTSELPNYLADPVLEIDPTSFGSYTTALRGEHVPLTGVILGELGPRYPFQSFFQRLHWLVTGRWGPYSLDYFKKFDTVLVVYDWRRGAEIKKFTQRLRRAYPHTIVIGVPTHPFGALREAWRDTKHLFTLMEFYDSCNVVLSIVRSTVPYQQSLTKTPVVYLPQPYPVEFASQFWCSFPQKESTLFLAGEVTRPDILAGHLAAKEIQSKHRSLTIHVTATPGSPPNVSLLQGTKYEIISFRPWREYLTYIARVSLVLNTDTWWTRGRVQADCAAVGTPSIGGPSDGQQELFPDLLVRDVEDFTTINKYANELLGDLEFYSKVTTKARRRLQSYNFEKTIARFAKLVSLARENRAVEFPELVWKHDVLVESQESKNPEPLNT